MSINEYAAYIHILGDLLQSIGVIFAALVIVIWPSASIADPISTLIFACLVMATTYKITK
jgi:zinc transporter 2